VKNTFSQLKYDMLTSALTAGIIPVSKSVMINDGAKVVPFLAAIFFNSLNICLYVAAFLSTSSPKTQGTP
jgi:hypothetical protein